jgi:hypothetical protein
MARRGVQNGPAAWSAVVMHPARCHAKAVPGAELDGESGQCGQDGIRIRFLLSVVCKLNQQDAILYGGEGGILLISQSRAPIRSWAWGHATPANVDR